MDLNDDHIGFLNQWLDNHGRVFRGFEQARQVAAVLQGKKQLLADLDRRKQSKQAEIDKLNAETLDEAKAQAAKILDNAKTAAKLAAVEGHDLWKKNLADLQAQIAEKRAELAAVEAKIAALKNAAAQFAGA